MRRQPRRYGINVDALGHLEGILHVPVYRLAEVLREAMEENELVNLRFASLVALAGLIKIGDKLSDAAVYYAEEGRTE